MACNRRDNERANIMGTRYRTKYGNNAAMYRDESPRDRWRREYREMRHIQKRAGTGTASRLVVAMNWNARTWASFRATVEQSEQSEGGK